MLAEIGTREEHPAFLADVKDRDSHARLMGFGHRVYKNYDPRAKIIQKACHDVLDELGIKGDPLLDLAMELEKIALNDQLFRRPQAVPERRLLFGHHPQGDGLPDQHVHRAVRRVPHGGLGQPVEGDDGGSATAHRPSAAGLHRRGAAGLRRAGRTRIRRLRGTGGSAFQ